MKAIDYIDQMIKNCEEVLDDEVYIVTSVKVTAYNRFATNFDEIEVTYMAYEEEDGSTGYRFSRDYMNKNNKLLEKSWIFMMGRS